LLGGEKSRGSVRQGPDGNKRERPAIKFQKKRGLEKVGRHYKFGSRVNNEAHRSGCSRRYNKREEHHARLHREPLARHQRTLPALETWPNQFPATSLPTRFPEYSSVCPKTGSPTSAPSHPIHAKKIGIELKALENVSPRLPQLGHLLRKRRHRMLRDIVAAVKPEWCVVRGDSLPRRLDNPIFAAGRDPAAPRRRTK